MHGDHGLRLFCDLPLKVVRIEVQILPDIGEHRGDAEIDEHAVVGIPGKRRDDDLVPRSEAGGRDGALERRGAGGDRERESRPDLLFQLRLGVPDLGGRSDPVEAERALFPDHVGEFSQFLVSRQRSAEHRGGEGFCPYRRSAVDCQFFHIRSPIRRRARAGSRGRSCCSISG